MRFRDIKSIQAKINNWFVDVRKPLITRDGIDEQVVAQNRHTPKVAKSRLASATTTAATSIRQQCIDLDSLARDIEGLLDEDDLEDENNKDRAPTEPDYYYHTVSRYDHETLFLDDTVGHCCSVKSSSDSDSSFVAVVVAAAAASEYLPYETKSRNSHSSITEPTPTPLFHDYLPAVATSRLTTTTPTTHLHDNSLASTLSSKRKSIDEALALNATVKKFMDDDARSILSTAALSRFAKFSPKFHEFTVKQGV